MDGSFVSFCRPTHSTDARTDGYAFAIAVEYSTHRLSICCNTPSDTTFFSNYRCSDARLANTSIHCFSHSLLCLVLHILKLLLQTAAMFTLLFIVCSSHCLQSSINIETLVIFGLRNTVVWLNLLYIPNTYAKLRCLWKGYSSNCGSPSFRLIRYHFPYSTEKREKC